MISMQLNCTYMSLHYVAPSQVNGWFVMRHQDFTAGFPNLGRETSVFRHEGLRLKRLKLWFSATPHRFAIMHLSMPVAT